MSSESKPNTDAVLDPIRVDIGDLHNDDLDWLIAAIEGHTGLHDRRGVPAFKRWFNPEGSADEWVHGEGPDKEYCCYDYFRPTSRWEQGGPILEKHRINTVWHQVEGKWIGQASLYSLAVRKVSGARLYTISEDQKATFLHESKLKAGMLALVRLHYGETVEYPFETVARKS